MNLKPEKVLNWLLPPLFGGSIYTIIFISGQFEPEILAWQPILFHGFGNCAAVSAY